VHKYEFFHKLFGQTLMRFTSYRVLILSGNYRVSLPVNTPPRMWAVSWMVYVNMTKKLTRSGSQLLSDKIMTPYYDVEATLLTDIFTADDAWIPIFDRFLLSDIPRIILI